MALTGEQIEKALWALLPTSGGATDESSILDVLARLVVHVEITDGGTAATDQAEKTCYVNMTGVNMKVTAVKVTCPVAVTSSDTTNKVISVQKRPASAPGTPAAVAAPDTSATGANSLGTTPLGVAWTACAAPAASLTPANLVLLPGDTLTVKTTHGSTGVAIATSTAPAVVDIFLEPSS